MLSKLFKYFILSIFLFVISVDYVIPSPLDGLITWATVSCDDAGVLAREGIQKFYNNPTIGMKMIDSATSACSSKPEFIYNLGVAYYKIGKMDEAESQFRGAIRKNNSFREAKIALAWVLIVGEIDIEEGIEKAKVLLKENKDFILMYAIGYGLDLKKNDEWKIWMDKAKKRALAENMENISRYVEVIKETEASTDLNERLKTLYTELGFLYEKIFEYRTAKNYFKKAESAQGGWGLGKMYARIGMAEKARENFEKSIDLSLGLNQSEIKRLKKDLKNVEKRVNFFKKVINFVYPEEFINIPSGEFYMGTNEGHEMEQPEHAVFLDGYSVGKYEVTNTEYKLYVDSSGYIPPYNCCKEKYDVWNKSYISASLANKPVVNVSWYEAKRYITWKNQHFGTEYRLPTEAEWEKAARGNDRRLYPWGNSQPTSKIANFNRHWSEHGTFNNVTKYSKGKSAFGLFNMSGSVWEWTNDWFGQNYYEKGYDKNPRGPRKGDFKVTRGGSWMNAAEYVTTVFRNRSWPGGRYNGVGFRLVSEL